MTRVVLQIFFSAIWSNISHLFFQAVFGNTAIARRILHGLNEVIDTSTVLAFGFLVRIGYRFVV